MTDVLFWKFSVVVVSTQVIQNRKASELQKLLVWKGEFKRGR